MFINPPEPGTTVEESLRMGGRHTMMRVEGEIVHVTTIIVTDLDPEPPLFEVTHISFVEKVKGFRETLASWHETCPGLEAALLEMNFIHSHPPIPPQ